MVELGSVVIALKAVDEASSVMDKVRASCGILSGAIGQLGGGFESVGSVISGFAGAGVAGAAIAATGELIQGLKWSVGQAAEAEQAIKNLSIAVEKSGTSWDSVKEGTLSALSELQKFTVYSDEQLAATLQRLLTFGMSYDEAMKTLGTATDLAAAKNMDLQSAADLVGKAFMGNTAILQRYGIDITTSKEATATMKEAVDGIAGALKAAGADALAPFTDVLGEAGVALADSEGKTRKFKEVAEELIGAFQSGQVDAESFSQIMSALGISIDTSKLKAADFPEIMAALNEQFGGTAQEQAKTYAGIQERFKNAVSDLGEKVGGILLPALSGMTEAMIPVADWFGKGVDAVQAWLTEVGKMPEVQGIMSAVNEAFQGFWSYLEDLWKFIQDTFGPVLQELWQAFKDLWDALSPIGEAFSEILGIFGEGTEGIDLLKAAVMAIAFEIRGFAEIIKAVAPYIRGFAEAFKTAAEFIAPHLKAMMDAIGGFIKWLRETFEGFYKWLVGGSLWQDMWNALLDVADSAFKKLLDIFDGALGLLGDALKHAWDQLQTYLGDALVRMRDTLAAGWQIMYDKAIEIWNTLEERMAGIVKDIHDRLLDTWNELSSSLTKIMSDMKDWLTSAWATIQTNVTDAMNQISGTVTNILGNIEALFSTSFQNLQGLFQSGLNAVQTLWDNAWQGTQQAGETVMNQIQSGVEGFTGAVSDTMQEGGAAIQTTASNAWNTVTNTIQGALNAAGSAVQGFWNWLVGGSVWPEALDRLIAVTAQKMAVLVGVVQGKIAALAAQYQAATGQAAPVTEALSDMSVAAQELTEAAAATVAQISQVTETVEQVSVAVQSTTLNLDALMTITDEMIRHLTSLGATRGIDRLTSEVARATDLFQRGSWTIEQFKECLLGLGFSAEQLSRILVTGSIWPDMLDEMQRQTEEAMANISGAFAGTFGEITLEAPAHVGRATPTPATLAPAGEIGVNMPVNLWVDGERVLTVLQRRQIRKYLLQRGVGS